MKKKKSRQPKVSVYKCKNCGKDEIPSMIKLVSHIRNCRPPIGMRPHSDEGKTPANGAMEIAQTLKNIAAELNHVADQLAGRRS